MVMAVYDKVIIIIIIIIVIVIYLGKRFCCDIGISVTFIGLNNGINRHVTCFTKYTICLQIIYYSTFQFPQVNNDLPF